MIRFEGVIEHASEAVGSNEGAEEGFLSDFGVIFVGLNEFFDVNKTAGSG